MRNDMLGWGGLIAFGLIAGLLLPKLANKGRLTLRRATGTIYRSGVSNPGVSAGADPARAVPAA